MEATNKIYSPIEAAKVLGVNKEHVLKLIKTGKLAASNIGFGQRAVYRISEKDISKYLQNAKSYGSRAPQNQENS